MSIVTAAAVYMSWQVLAPFVDVLIWSAVLTILTYPLYDRLRRRYGPNLSAVATVVATILTVVIPLTLMTVLLVLEAGRFAGVVQEMLRTLLDPESKVFKFVSKFVDLKEFLDPATLTDQLRSFSGVILSQTTGVLGSAAGVGIKTAFVLFAMFYLLQDGERGLRAVRDMLPLSDADVTDLFKRTRDVIYASMVGVVLIAAIQGVLGAFGFWMLGLPSALLWGFVMFILSMVPAVGAFLVWGPAALYLVLTGDYVKAGMLVAWGGLVIGMIDNLLRPRIVGDRVKMNELVILFSVLGGLKVFGIVGLVVGPVVIAVTLALLEVVKRLARSETESATVAETTTQA
jgi:predicted PurR-regulated permease PerM